MKIDNLFDKKLKLNQDIPNEFRNALTDVSGTLEFSWAMAQAVFEDRATPEHAIAICTQVMQERARSGKA